MVCFALASIIYEYQNILEIYLLIDQDKDLRAICKIFILMKRQIIRTMDDRNYSCLCFHND